MLGTKTGPEPKKKLLCRNRKKWTGSATLILGDCHSRFLFRWSARNKPDLYCTVLPNIFIIFLYFFRNSGQQSDLYAE